MMIEKGFKGFVLLILISMFIYGFGLLMDAIKPFTSEEIRLLVMIPYFVLTATVPYALVTWLEMLITKSPNHSSSRSG